MFRSAFTLVELVIVLVILTALASTVVPLIDGGMEIDGKTMEQITTETNLRTIRDALLGSAQEPGAWVDLGQNPAMLAVFANFGLNQLQSESAPAGLSASLQTFDPVTKLGWRGPYLSGTSAFVDGWGNPIALQVDFDQDGVVSELEARYARLVAPGENGQFETPNDYINMAPGADPGSTLTLEECGDDVVLFLRTGDTRQ